MARSMKYQNTSYYRSLITENTRKEQTIFTRVRIGYTRLTLMNPSPIKCEICHASHTVSHITTEGPIYNLQIALGNKEKYY